MRSWLNRSLLLMLAITLPPVIAQADVRLPAVVGDHMVLQRDLPLPIWGWAAPGEDVTVTFGEHKVTAKTDATGKWKVTLPAMKSGGGPLEMTIWEAQTATLEFPNTGMAVTTDIVANLSDIHPPNKQDVGKRLALWALAKTYAKADLVFSGPLFDSQEIESDQIRLKFKHAEAGLLSRDGKALNWFSVAGEDKKFYAADAAISGNTIVVKSSKVPKPVAVRFGWHEIAEPNLMNKAGLPATPFRTDKWTDAVPAF